MGLSAVASFSKLCWENSFRWSNQVETNFPRGACYDGCVSGGSSAPEATVEPDSLLLSRPWSIAEWPPVQWGGCGGAVLNKPSTIQWCSYTSIRLSICSVVRLLGGRVTQNKRFVLILTKLGLRKVLEVRWRDGCLAKLGLLTMLEDIVTIFCCDRSAIARGGAHCASSCRVTLLQLWAWRRRLWRSSLRQSQP